MFDDGHLKDDPVKSQGVIDRLLFRLGMGNENKPPTNDPPLIQVINSVWDRIFKVFLDLSQYLPAIRPR